jgi:aspartate/tyrosine/aromatic aminotransferase
MPPTQQRNPNFHAVQPAPPDAILGLTEAFKADPRSEKINLGVGVFKDEKGQTPVLNSVKEAEQRLLAGETTKSYKPIAGDPVYRQLTQNLLFGEKHELATGARAHTADTPGGTGALRIAGDFIKHTLPEATVWLPDPTWANHPAIFEAAGVPTRAYAYYDPSTFGLDFDAMTDALGQAKAGDVVLLHGCCHNPSGVDLGGEQWRQIASRLAERGLLPLIDFAYQGFADGIEQDAAGLRCVAEACDELLVCSSYSKNFGLYNERVGALTIVAGSGEAASAVFSRIEQTIRRNYSNPPAHGASVVQTILADAKLRQTWDRELAGMRDRIHQMRRRFAEALDERNVSLSPQGNEFVTRQRGMFSFTGLGKEQVQALREKHAIYMVGSGRINVAGISEESCGRLCDAIAAVIHD